MIKFENRKQQRKTCETMGALLVNFKSFVNEETKEAIELTLRILNSVEVEEKKED